jgi:hypothetical protein
MAGVCHTLVWSTSSWVARLLWEGAGETHNGYLRAAPCTGLCALHHDEGCPPSIGDMHSGQNACGQMLGGHPSACSCATLLELLDGRLV